MHPADERRAYVPGYQPDTMRMLTARTAVERAGLLLPRLADGMRVLDLGCGPGSITAGLAAAVAPHGVVLAVDHVVAQLRMVPESSCRVASAAEALPVRAGALDVVFAHAVFEHLTAPRVVLAEIRRVLRPGGLLALSSSDWSGARIEPRAAAVDTAVRAYCRLRQRGGTDPYAGRHLADHVRAAGFTLAETRATGRVDMGYTELATYLGDRLAAHADMAAGALAAGEWARGGPGEFIQRWVDVLAIA